MKTGLKCLFVIVASNMLLTGCCMMRNAPTQLVSITSTPPGATATIQPSGAEVVTPSDVSLKRKTAYYSVTLKKDGYEPARIKLVRKSSGLWRNLIWIHPVGWVIGIVVDTSTGCGYELQPDKIDVKFTPLQDTTPPKPVAPKNSP
jgi:PEGA domain